MTYADFFYEIKGKFMGTDVSDIKEHLAFQFSIADEEAGGSFYVEVKEGQLYVEPYEYYDRDANFISDPDTFLKIAEGKTDPVWAFTAQKLKVEGNIDKALRLKEIIDLKLKQKKAAEKENAKKASEEDGAKKASEEDGAKKASEEDGAKKASEKENAKNVTEKDGTKSASEKDGIKNVPESDGAKKLTKNK